MDESIQYWALIPAAGIGSRMGSDIPKQFLKLGDRMIIQWGIEALVGHSMVSGVAVGLSQAEYSGARADSVHSSGAGIFVGGVTRAHTVLNGLQYLCEEGAAQDDWVLVHDANRPFIQHSDIDLLIGSAGSDRCGAVMCAPVYDTVKQTASGHVAKTLPRESIFRAQTPQMFKIGMLRHALGKALGDGIEVSDESQAMEYCGTCPKVVVGPSRNIKITTPDDWLIAQALLGIS